jgi:4-amino-4-deoxy-L-arabinose transferase-like glycosyltransferase
MSFRLQEFIHSVEEGAGKKILSGIVAVVVMAAMMTLFDTLWFRNMTTPEGMEAAQLARNIAEGNGYTTGMIRPLAVRLIQQKQGQTGAVIKEALPDLQNPPLYPVLLAGWLKIMPFRYVIPSGQNFDYHRPDFWIAIFNQLLLVAAAFLVHRLASQLFDSTAGWMSLGILATTWLYWQFTFTGHSTLLLVVLFLLLVFSLFKADEAASAETPSAGRIATWAVLAGIFLGLGGLTRYSFLWLIFPVLAFFMLLMRPFRVLPGLLALVACLVVFSPWMFRNLQVSGAPFGTAGFAIYEETESFPADEVQRALHPNFQTFDYHEVRRKFFYGIREVISDDLPRLGGNWLGVLSLVGLLIPFRRPTLNRLRWFLVLSLFFLMIAQAGGKTIFSKENPGITSENLLAIAAPLAFIFGVGLVLSLVDQLRLSHPLLNYLTLVGVVLVCAAPMLLAVVPPRPYATKIVYPPYYPPFFQRIGRLNEQGTATLWAKELIMSDVPEAIVWYSRCPAALLTLHYQNDPGDKVKDDFFEFSDYRKTVRALYLTSRTMKALPVKSVALTGKDVRTSWENFVGLVLKQGRPPENFPLQNWVNENIWPEQFYAEIAPAK